MKKDRVYLLPECKDNVYVAIRVNNNFSEVSVYKKDIKKFKIVVGNNNNLVPALSYIYLDGYLICIPR